MVMVMVMAMVDGDGLCQFKVIPRRRAQMQRQQELIDKFKSDMSQATMGTLMFGLVMAMAMVMVPSPSYLSQKKAESVNSSLKPMEDTCHKLCAQPLM